jgi:predicted kinase
MRKRLILVGGSAGSGKSTVAQTLAGDLGAGWLLPDTEVRCVFLQHTDVDGAAQTVSFGGLAPPPCWSRRRRGD